MFIYIVLNSENNSDIHDLISDSGTFETDHHSGSFMIWVPPVENWMKYITFYTTMRPSSHYASHPFDNYVSVVAATNVSSYITISGRKLAEAVEWIPVSTL